MIIVNNPESNEFFFSIEITVNRAKNREKTVHYLMISVRSAITIKNNQRVAMIYLSFTSYIIIEQNLYRGKSVEWRSIERMRLSRE